MNVLVLNAGSSSLKFQVIATDLHLMQENQDIRICRGEVEGIGGQAAIRIRYRDQAEHRLAAELNDIAASLKYLVSYMVSDRSGISEITGTADLHAIGHRVVHGGERFKESTLIDDHVLNGIQDCIDLAPLHNPDNIKGILAAREQFGKDTPQVAVFDTAFHQSIS